MAAFCAHFSCPNWTCLEDAEGADAGEKMSSFLRASRSAHGSRPQEAGTLCSEPAPSAFFFSLAPQAMHLVYRALEKEPVPSVLPPQLVPPSKRKKTVFAGAVPVLPASPPPKDSLRSTPSHGSVSSLNSTGSLSPKHSVKQTQVSAKASSRPFLISREEKALIKFF